MKEDLNKYKVDWSTDFHKGAVTTKWRKNSLYTSDTGTIG
jgi:hypothetical protein